jgi:eukaryotic-like serine/threonine-protein kinase
VREPAPSLALTPRGRVLPPALVHVVMRCLERNPDARWQTATELAYALERAGAPAPVVLHAQPRPSQLLTPGELPAVSVSTRPPGPSHGLALAAAATLCGLALTGMAAGILAHRSGKSAARPVAEATSLPSPAASSSAKLPARFPAK